MYGFESYMWYTHGEEEDVYIECMKWFLWLSSFLKLTTREIKRDMLHQKIHDELIKYIIPSTGMIKEVKIKLWGSCKVVIVFTIFTKL